MWKKRHRIYRIHPFRSENHLRSTNITDDEVREIESAMHDVAPGAMVNIGSVTVGCPCNDGPECSEQVWVVAYKPEASRGVSLSRISEKWTIGPLQRWWLDYETIPDWRPELSREEATLLATRRAEMYDAFPNCVE